MRDFELLQNLQTAIGRGKVSWAEPFAAYGKYVATGAITNQAIWPDGTFPIPAGPFPSGSVVLNEVTVDKAATITSDWFGWLENA